MTLAEGKVQSAAFRGGLAGALEDERDPQIAQIDADKPFRVTLDGCSEAALESWAVEWLRDRGWWVARPGEWETPRETRERLHISSAHLARTLRCPAAPKPADTVKGPTGRVIYLRSTPVLDSFLTRHLSKSTQPQPR